MSSDFKENKFIDFKNRDGKASSVGCFLSKIVGKNFLKRGFVGVDIISSWKDIVEADIAQFSMPIRCVFKGAARADGILHVKCAPAFGMTLSYKKKYIVDSVNRYFGYNAVADVKIIVDYDFFKEDLKEDKRVPLISKEKIESMDIPVDQSDEMGYLLKQYYAYMKQKRDEQKK